ncbi:MAG: hypothetical protein WCL28_03370 [bacterium]|jgi:hypothetical protein
MSRRGRGGKNRNNGRHGGGGERHQGQPQKHDGRNPPRDRQNQAQSTNGAPSETRQGQAGKFSFQSAIQPKRTLNRPPKEPTVVAGDDKRQYKLIFFDTLVQAKSDLENLKQIAAGCDQLNIVVRAEASMDDAELTAIGKLFCGAAWALIHERRRDAGWYEQTHE